MSISSSTGFNVKEQSNIASPNSKTLYVGGSGPGNYTKIQDAINNASDRDTVYVYNDSSPYYENVVVDKSIYLIGEDRNSTVIDGNQLGDVVHISADRINFRRFTIKNGSDDGIVVYNSSSIIKNNIIKENMRVGIILFHSNRNIIQSNTISNNKDGIILLQSRSDVVIDNYILENKLDGVYLSFSNGNTIMSNDISDALYGITLSFVSNTTVQKNNIHNNFVGIGTSVCNKIRIEKNNFIDNKMHASCSYSWISKWNENYWDNWIGIRTNLPIFQKFPKKIRGGIYPEIPLLPQKFDWHPALKPYDI